tara:strand:- start:435 stop:716 length:282 start_codon:yes stop_codon:yes gene_type:complete
MEVYMAKVLNKRDSGVPAGAVYVGRPSKFGNPYEIGRDGSREEVIQKYEAWLLTADNGLSIDDLLQLKGKDLVCWCAPLACHAEVLLKYIPTE